MDFLVKEGLCARFAMHYPFNKKKMLSEALHFFILFSSVSPDALHEVTPRGFGPLDSKKKSFASQASVLTND